MIGIVEQHPNLGIGWWWEFSHNDRRHSGYAVTKRGAMRAMKRRHKNVMKQGQRVEVELQ